MVYVRIIARLYYFVSILLRNGLLNIEERVWFYVIYLFKSPLKMDLSWTFLPIWNNMDRPFYPIQMLVNVYSSHIFQGSLH